MQVISKKINYMDIKDFKGNFAYESDSTELVEKDTIITDAETGQVLLLYKKLNNDTSKLLKAVKSIKYNEGQRTGGLASVSAIFGYRPRNAIRNDYCSATTIKRDFDWQHSVITDFGKVLSKEYEKHLKEKFEEHQELIKEKVKDEWVIEDTPFTSGIINKDNRLAFHRDQGNFAGLYSNMVVLKKDVDGGRLYIPELGVKVDCADNTIVYFDGQRLIHGVTEIKKKNKSAYRYTLVYYSLQQMWKCETLEEEVARINKIKANRH